jgi:transposase-like protein
MFSEMKTEERNEARRMRRDEGRAIKEIARLVGVSPSSVSGWVRDIELTHAQHAALQARNGLHERQRLAHAAMAAKARARRAAAQREHNLVSMPRPLGPFQELAGFDRPEWLDMPP